MTKRIDNRYCKTKMIGGKQKYFYGKSEKEAAQKRDTFCKNIIRGIETKPLNQYVLFSDIADKWLASQEVNVKGSTHEGYLYKVIALKKHFKNMYLHNMTYSLIESYLNDLLVKNHFAKSTIKKYRQVINSILSYAEKDGIIVNNTCQKTRVPKNAITTIRRCLNTEEEAILLSPANFYFKDFALFIYYTGLRFSEIVPLKWSDIDIENAEITVQRVVSYVNGRPQIDNFLKNGDSSRVIPIYKPLLSLINSIPVQGEFVFVNTKGAMMARNTVRKRWNKFQIESGLVEVTPHMLRHTFATNLYYAGVDVKTIQKISGHKDISVLFNRYIHDDYLKVKGSSEIMDEYFKIKSK